MRLEPASAREGWHVGWNNRAFRGCKGKEELTACVTERIADLGSVQNSDMATEFLDWENKTKK